MSFPSALAGPSRLPIQAVRQSLLPAVRRYATVHSKASPSGSETTATASQSQTPATGGRGRRDRQVMPYDQWLGEVAQEYAQPRRGEKARWLGGYEAPYPTNPSFRPPAPLSNAVQDSIYRQMLSGSKTADEISVEHGVSKARMIAIKKLKEIEAEFRRQGVPLQTAFQSEMEPLLGMKSSARSRWDRIEPELDQSTEAELEEERRWEVGIGAGGSFGQRESRGKADGIERSVFEWRSEDDVAENTDAEQQNHSQLSSEEGTDATFAVEERFPTPATEKVLGLLAKRERVEPSSHYVKRTATTGFRFLDVAKTGGVYQHPQVFLAMRKREKLRNKRNERRARVKGL